MKQFDVAKVEVNEELGIVFGWAIVCKQNGVEYFDLQGDHIPEAAMLRASAEFMQDHRVAGYMHKGASADMLATAEDFEKVEPRGEVLFALPLTEELAKALGIECPRTGLIIGMKPDADMLKRFKSGELTGFSIGGSRIEDEEVD